MRSEEAKPKLVHLDELCPWWHRPPPLKLTLEGCGHPVTFRLQIGHPCTVRAFSEFRCHLIFCRLIPYFQ